MFAAYYAAESVRQSAQGKCTSQTGTGGELLCPLVLRSVLQDYFGKDGMVEYNPMCARVLTTDQTCVWAMLVALYTLGLVAFVVDSDAVAKRVQSAVNVLWPCIKEIALGNVQS